MIILLEGPDGSGKTTLAKEIERLGGATRLHAGKPGPEPLVDYIAPIADRDTFYVLDRWHVGELVYGPLHRGGSRLTPAGARAINELLASRGCLLIHCTADLATLCMNLRRRGDRPHDSLGYERIRFWQVINDLPHETWIHTTRAPVSAQAAIDRVKELAR